MFISQTPYRYFPVESHTTGLPLINYLPDAVALRYARRFSLQVKRDESWEDLLRRGIRGATEKEIMDILSKDVEHRPLLLEPDRMGLKDRIDLWFLISGKVRLKFIKNIFKKILKIIKISFKVILVPTLTIAIQKKCDPVPGK